MAEEVQLPIRIVIHDEALDAVEDRVKKGLEMPVRAGEEGTRRATTAAPSAQTRPTPTTPAIAGPLGAQIAAAQAAGDTAKVSQLMEEAQRAGFTVPSEAPVSPAVARRVERSWDAAQFAQFREDERRSQRVDRSFDAAALSRQKRDETRATRVDRTWEDAEFARFREEEKRAVRETAEAKRAEARSVREDAAERRRMRTLSNAQFQASISDMSPTGQLNALNRRMEQTADPMERARLQQQAGRLGRHTGWNREVLGMGNYMTALFGGWELATALGATRRGEIEASFAMTPQDANMARLQGLQQATGGILGSVVREVGNVIGRFTPLPSFAKMEEEVLGQQKLQESINFVSEGRREARFAQEERQARRLGGEFAVAQSRIMADREREVTPLAQQIADINTQLRSGEDEAAKLSFEQAYALSQEGGSQSASGRRYLEQAELSNRMAYQQSEPAVVLRRTRDELQRRKDELGPKYDDQIRILNEQFAEAVQDQVEVRESFLDRLADVPTREVERRARGRRFGQELRDANKVSPILLGFTMARQIAENQLEEREADRRDLLITSQLRYQNVATQAQMEGRYLESAAAATTAQFNPQFNTQGMLTQVGGIRLGEAGFGEQFQAYQQSLQKNAQDEQRRLILNQGQAQAMRYQFGAQPFTAQMQMLVSQRQAALTGITDPAEIGRIEERFALDAALAAQARAFQRQDINLSQDTRRMQLGALRDRNPIGAQAQGVAAQARAEELGLLRQGMPVEASIARGIGIEQLDLLKRDYLEGFRGVQLASKDMLAAVFNFRDNEDVNKALSSVAGAKESLMTQGTVPTGADVVAEIKNLPQAMKTIIETALQSVITP